MTTPITDWSQVRVSWTERMIPVRGGKEEVSERTTLAEYVRRITSDGRIQERTESARKLYIPNLPKGGGEGYDKVKGGMSCIMPSVDAPPGALVAEIGEQHNGLYSYDIDINKEKLDLPAGLASLDADTHVVLADYSFSGSGLYAIVAGPVAANRAEYQRNWRRIAERLPGGLAANTGIGSHNLNRKRVAAHSAGPVVHWDATPWTLEELEPDEPAPAEDAPQNNAKTNPSRPLTGAEVNWLTENLSKLPLPGSAGHDHWLGIIGHLRDVGVDITDAIAWSTSSEYPDGGEKEVRAAWNNFNRKDPRLAFNIVAKELRANGATGQPGHQPDWSVSISDSERNWVLENYSKATADEKTAVSRAATFVGLGADADKVFEWANAYLPPVRAAAFPGLLDAEVRADSRSDRKRYQDASRWLKAANVSGQPPRPKPLTARQERAAAAEPITAEDVSADYTGLGDPYGPEDCSPLAVALRLVAHKADHLLAVKFPKGVVVPLVDNGYGIWREDLAAVQALIGGQINEWVNLGKALLIEKSNPKGAEALGRWAKSIQSPFGWSEIIGSVGAAVNLLRSAGKLPPSLTTCTSDQINRDGMVIGTPTGVLCLQTGKLLPPAEGRHRLVSRCIPDPYDPEASHPLIDAITEHVPDDLVQWAWDTAGYAMVAEPGRMIHIKQGPGHSGKTTIHNFQREASGVWNATISGYGAGLSPTALIQDRISNANQHSEHLLPFVFARMITAADLANRKANDELMKMISGGDPLPVRGANARTEEDRPASGTLFISANEGWSKNLNLADEALVGRLYIVPWPKREGPEVRSVVTAAARDKKLRQAVFAKMVRHLLALNGEPPVPPPAVIRFTAEAVERGLSDIAGFCLRVRQQDGAELLVQDVWEAACLEAGADPGDAKAECWGLNRTQLIAEVRSRVHLPKPVRLRRGDERVFVWKNAAMDADND